MHIRISDRWQGKKLSMRYRMYFDAQEYAYFGCPKYLSANGNVHAGFIVSAFKDGDAHKYRVGKDSGKYFIWLYPLEKFNLSRLVEPEFRNCCGMEVHGVKQSDRSMIYITHEVELDLENEMKKAVNVLRQLDLDLAERPEETKVGSFDISKFSIRLQTRRRGLRSPKSEESTGLAMDFYVPFEVAQFMGFPSHVMFFSINPDDLDKMMAGSEHVMGDPYKNGICILPARLPEGHNRRVGTYRFKGKGQSPHENPSMWRIESTAYLFGFDPDFPPGAWINMPILPTSRPGNIRLGPLPSDPSKWTMTNGISVTRTMCEEDDAMVELPREDKLEHSIEDEIPNDQALFDLQFTELLHLRDKFNAIFVGMEELKKRLGYELVVWIHDGKLKVAHKQK